MSDLSNEVVLVTGASGPIGAAIAQRPVVTMQRVGGVTALPGSGWVCPSSLPATERELIVRQLGYIDGLRLDRQVYSMRSHHGGTV
jgi:hypothetical protein